MQTDCMVLLVIGERVCYYWIVGNFRGFRGLASTQENVTPPKFLWSAAEAYVYLHRHSDDHQTAVVTANDAVMTGALTARLPAVPAAVWVVCCTAAVTVAVVAVTSWLLQ